MGGRFLFTNLITIMSLTAARMPSLQDKLKAEEIEEIKAAEAKAKAKAEKKVKKLGKAPKAKASKGGSK